MDWLKKHADAVVVIGAICASMIWMNTQFKDVRKEMTLDFKEVDTQFAGIRKDIAEMRTEVEVMKTVLIMKGIMPDAYAYKNAKVDTNG